MGKLDRLLGDLVARFTYLPPNVTRRLVRKADFALLIRRAGGEPGRHESTWLEHLAKALSLEAADIARLQAEPTPETH